MSTIPPKMPMPIASPVYHHFCEDGWPVRFGRFDGGGGDVTSTGGADMMLEKERATATAQSPRPTAQLGATLLRGHSPCRQTRTDSLDRPRYCTRQVQLPTRTSVNRETYFFEGENQGGVGLIGNSIRTNDSWRSGSGAGASTVH